MKNLIAILISFFIIGNIFSQNDDCNRLDVIGVPTHTEDPVAPYTPTTINCPPDCPAPPPITSDERERIVYWIHGFGGDQYALSNVTAITTNPIPHNFGGYINDKIDYPARKIISNSPSYGTGQTLTIYGDIIGRNIQDFSESKNQTLLESKRNICITSSWGGNVSRMAEKTYNGTGGTGFRAGGIVSFGGSHDGAVLANNIITTASEEDAVSTEFNIFDGAAPGDLRATEKLNNFLRKASDSLLEGPKFDIIANNIILSLFEDGITDVVEAFRDELVNIIPKTIGTSLFTRTALNLQTTDPTQISLQSSGGQTVNIAAFGAEDSELGMWRLFYWGKTDPNNVPTALPSYDAEKGQGFFEATSDKFAEDVFNKNLANYQMKANEMDTQRENWKRISLLCIIPIYNNLNIGKCIQAPNKVETFEKARDGYQKGIRWFEDSSDLWELLTGALVFEQEKGECFCVDNNVTYSFPCDSVDDLATNNCTYKYFIPGDFVEKRLESDAVVLAKSAENFPGAIKVFRMEGSNHFQMRNDQNIKTVLFELFEGVEDDMNPINFFQTDERI